MRLCQGGAALARLVAGSAIAAGLLASALPAAAAAPAAAEVALVEDVDAPSSGVQFMDYLKSGQVIRLRPGEKIVIDYLSSCGRETISAGTITIGTDESLVAGGQIHRERVECDGGKMLLTADQANKSGVMVFRKILPKAQPSLTLFGASPLIEVKGGGKVVLERLDQPGDSRIVEVPAGKAPPADLYDFAKHDLALAPGGTYRATAGDKAVVFKVAPSAKPGPSPIVGRLIRF
jgi:hypothetical protein